MTQSADKARALADRLDTYNRFSRMPDHALTQAVAFLRALADQWEAAPAREWWQLVPVEPTAAMVTAGGADFYEAMRDGVTFGDRARQCYRAMLAASPPPEPPAGLER